MHRSGRFVAFSLAISIFFTNCLFAHSIESSVWSERRHIIEAQTSSLKGFVDAIPTSRATIEEIHFSGIPQGPVVVLLQDVHMNPDAQANIARVLGALMDRKKAPLVAVEGAFDVFDFSLFRSLPDTKKRNSVATSALKENRLGAPSYVGITRSAELPPFIGIDDRVHHQKNVEAYRAALKIKDRAVESLNHGERSLKAADYLLLSRKLVNFSLRPDEWEAYSRSMVHRQWTIDHKNFQAFENFYREADIRSDLMVKNLQGRSAVVVVGGFHTPRMAQGLREKKISYVVVTPKFSIEAGAPGSSYLSSFLKNPALEITHQPTAAWLLERMQGVGTPVATPINRKKVRVIGFGGGYSTRFWPYNKVFEDFTGVGRSLIQQTVDHVTESGFLPPEQVHVVTIPDFEKKMRAQLQAVIPGKNVSVVPVIRSALASFLWTVAEIKVEEPDATLVNLSGDILIKDTAALQAMLDQAILLSQRNGGLVSIGMTPTDNPSDWVRFGAMKGGSGSTLVRFEEKPTLARAGEMVKEGGWLWNLGSQVGPISAFEKILAKHQPRTYELYTQMCAAVAAGDLTKSKELLSQIDIKIQSYTKPGEMVDNSLSNAIVTPAVLAHTVEMLLVAGSFEWLDMGTYDTLRQTLPADEHGNIVRGGPENIRLKNVTNSTLLADPGRKINAENIDGLVVINSADEKALVVPERRASEVNKIAAKDKGPVEGVINIDTQASFVVANSGLVGVLGLFNTAVNLTGNVLTVRGAHEENNTMLGRGKVLAEFGDLNVQPERLIEILSENLFLKNIFLRTAGVDKYVIGEHTIMAIRQFDRYFAHRFRPAHSKKGYSVEIGFFRLVLALHDIGKQSGDSYEQHLYTRAIIEDFLGPNGLGYDEGPVSFAVSLVGGDPIGRFIVYGTKEHFNDGLAQIRAAALNAGFTPIEFFEYLKMYQLSDASSYTSDAYLLTKNGKQFGRPLLDAVFSFDHTENTIRLSELQAARYQLLEQSLRMNETKFGDAELGLLFPSPSSVTEDMTENAKQLYHAYASAKELYDSAARYLGLEVEKLFLQPGDRNLSLYNRLATFLYELALIRALEERLGRRIVPKSMAGVSHGILPALVLAESLDPMEALNYIEKTIAIQDEVIDQVEYAIFQIGGIAFDEVKEFLVPNKVVLTRDASPAHITIAARDVDYEKLKEAIEKKVGSRAKVTYEYPARFKGPHTTFYDKTIPLIRDVVGNLKIKKPVIPIVNVSVPGGVLREVADVVTELVDLFNSPVQWSEAIVGLRMMGIQAFLEIGPGIKLSKYNDVLAPGLFSFSLNNPTTLALVSMLFPLVEDPSELKVSKPEVAGPVFEKDRVLANIRAMKAAA